MTASATPQPTATPDPTAKGILISRVLTAANSDAIISNRRGEFQARAADLFLTLAFKTEAELEAICKRVGC